MPYTVRARQDGQPVSTTRLQAGSAIVIALRWAEKGCQAIVIVDDEGRPQSLEDAQQERLRRLRSGVQLFG